MDARECAAVVCAHAERAPSKQEPSSQRKETVDRLAHVRANLLAGSSPSFDPLPGPSPDAVRLTLLVEIVAARGFDHDNLYGALPAGCDSLCWCGLV